MAAGNLAAGFPFTADVCQLECFCTKNAYVGVEGENDWVVVVVAVSLRTRGRDINDLFPVHLFFFLY